MRLLISWSKAQSKAVATALHGWLPTVVPGIQPWMSSKDIDKGKEWFAELQSVLAEARLCIICVTPENVRSPWIYYETGAIAAKGPDVLICPFLVGVSPNLLADGPLGKWQCTLADKEDSWGAHPFPQFQRTSSSARSVSPAERFRIPMVQVRC